MPANSRDNPDLANSGILPLLRDLRRAKREGITGIERRQQARLAELVAYAREHSPYFRKAYLDLPERVMDVTLLPVTSKRTLMPQFDEWVTDPGVSLERVRAFVDDPHRVGEKFDGKYRIGTSSGSSGFRGIFLLDQRSTTVTSAVTLRAFGGWLGRADAIRCLAGGGRVAMVIATGGHYGSSTVAPHNRRIPVRTFSVFAPLPDLVDQLNKFRPAIVMGYAGQIAVLATEQRAGRLRIRPRLVVLGAQGLTESGYERIASIFNTTVGNGYGACEFMCAAASCEYGWLHVNSDWVILEPVDAEYRPVPPGQQSYTVLLTNLANRIQPILRYDLGDAVLVRPEPCPCGNLLPAIQVQGRTTDGLTFDGSNGEAISIAPVALTGVVDRAPGVELSQIVQTSRTSVNVRLLAASDADAESVWTRVRDEIASSLATQRLSNVTIRRAAEAPQQSPGGKYRLIIPLADAEVTDDQEFSS